MELRTELLYLVERMTVEPMGIKRLFRYGLFRDWTSSNTPFFHMKCHMQVWQGPDMVREDADAAGGLGSDQYLAEGVFRLVVAAAEPVHPAHLSEVVHDQAIRARMLGVAWTKARGARASAARAGRRHRPGTPGVGGRGGRGGANAGAGNGRVVPFRRPGASENTGRIHPRRGE